MGQRGWSGEEAKVLEMLAIYSLVLGVSSAWLRTALWTLYSFCRCNWWVSRALLTEGGREWMVDCGGAMSGCTRCGSGREVCIELLYVVTVVSRRAAITEVISDCCIVDCVWGRELSNWTVPRQSVVCGCNCSGGSGRQAMGEERARWLCGCGQGWGRASVALLEELQVICMACVSSGERVVWNRWSVRLLP